MTKRVLSPPEQAASTVPAQRTSTAPLRRTAGVVVAFLTAWCFVAGAGYSVATPIFEAPDEPFHFAYVRWLASGRGLPVVDPLRPEAWRQEGTQPPLYYAIGALLTGWIDTGDLPLVLAFNPHARLGVPDARDNRNAVIHTPREHFPYRGSVLAVHLLRLFSAALAALTVLATYILAKAVWPQQGTAALLAAALVAVNPMFVFVSASVNNDALATLLATACLALTVSAAARPSRWGTLAAGAAGGLALLAKLNTAWVIPLAALYTGTHAYRREGPSSALRTAGATLLSTVAVAGWWPARNLMVYGDPTGLAAHLAVMGSVPRGEAAQLLDELAGLRFAFWGIFGWFNVLPPLTYYIPFWGAAGAGLAGLALRVLAERRRSTSATRPALPDRAPLWLLSGAVISALGSLVWWTFQTQGAQGRLLFPAWPAAAILLVYGWEQLAGARRLVPFGGALVAAQAVLVAVTPVAVIAPAYQLPASFRTAAGQARPAPAATAEFWQYDGRIALLAAELPATVRPGDPVVVTLHWRTLDAPGRNLSVYVQVLAPSGRKVGQRDSFPGGGLAPTVYWRAGDEFIERIAVPLEPDLPPGEYTVLVGLYDLAPPANLFLPAPASSDRVRDSRYTVAGQVRLGSMQAAAGQTGEEARRW
jgi:4-amino-4-deoxy-L-arabinose transferase-like glycosyltransferase